MYGKIHGILLDSEKCPIGRERELGDSRPARVSRLFLRLLKIGNAGRFGSGRLRLLGAFVERSSGRSAVAKPLKMLLGQLKRFLA